MLQENHPQTGAKIVKQRIDGLQQVIFSMSVTKNYINKKSL